MTKTVFATKIKFHNITAMLGRLLKKEATNVSRLQKVYKKFLTRGMAAAQRGEGGL